MGNPCGFTGGDMATGRASNGRVPGVFKPYETAYGPVGSGGFFPGNAGVHRARAFVPGRGAIFSAAEGGNSTPDVGITPEVLHTPRAWRRVV